MVKMFSHTVNYESDGEEATKNKVRPLPTDPEKEAPDLPRDPKSVLKQVSADQSMQPNFRRSAQRRGKSR